MILRTNFNIEDDTLLGKLGAIIFNKKNLSLRDNNLFLDFQTFYGQFCQHPSLDEWALCIPDEDCLEVESLLSNDEWEYKFIKNV